MYNKNNDDNLFFYRFKDDKGVSGNDIANVIGGEKKLRERLIRAGYYIEKIYNISKLKNKAQGIYWNKKKLIKFTNAFKTHLERGRAGLMTSEIEALRGVMRDMFDPVIYSLFVEVSGGSDFKTAIKNFPNIFDEVYIGIVDGFFGSKFEPIQGLQILEDNMIENQKFMESFIKSTATYLLAIAGGVLASFLLDIILYEKLVAEYATYGKLVPDFTTNYHNFLWLVLTYSPIFVGFILCLNYLLKYSKQEYIKIEFSKFILGLPIYGNILKEKIFYDFINIYTLLKEAETIIPSQILYLVSTSLPNYYARAIHLEIYNSVKNDGKNIGKEMKEYDLFNDADYIVTAFEGKVETIKELKTITALQRKKLDNTISKSLGKIMLVIILFAVTVFFCIAIAYVLPLQQKTALIKQQMNEEKMDNYINNKK